MSFTILGIDLAKSVFQLHGVNEAGKKVLQKKVSRSELIRFIANAPKCLIGMEACGGAHYWAREFRKFGHEVKLISPQFVRPFVKSNKNDQADAEAICEALVRPSMRFVASKGIDQQDIQSLHRARERIVKTRTALMNEIRGLLAEYGVVRAKGSRSLQKELLATLHQAFEQGQMTGFSCEIFERLLEELRELEERQKWYDARVQAIHRNHPVCQRIAEIPGIGPMTATAMIAAVADPKAFRNGRQMAAWIGLVPRQHSSGGKERLLGISKRGDVYLRKLLIHGARSVLRTIENQTETRQNIWLKKLVERRGMNRATVALANKNARKIWVLMAHEKSYDPAA